MPSERGKQFSRVARITSYCYIVIFVRRHDFEVTLETTAACVTDYRGKVSFINNQLSPLLHDLLLWEAENKNART